MVDLCLQAVLDEGVCILGEMSRNIRTSFVLYWKHIEPCLLESGCWARLTAAGKGKTSTFSLQLRKQHDALKCRSWRFPPRASKGSRDGNGVWSSPPPQPCWKQLHDVTWPFLTCTMNIASQTDFTPTRHLTHYFSIFLPWNCPFLPRFLSSVNACNLCFVCPFFQACSHGEL